MNSADMLCCTRRERKGGERKERGRSEREKKGGEGGRGEREKERREKERGGIERKQHLLGIFSTPFCCLCVVVCRR